MCVLTRLDVIRNEYRRGNLDVTNVVGKMSENIMRSFRFIERRNSQENK